MMKISRAKDPFDLLAPAVQEFILRNNWSKLRPIQNAAIPIIMGTNDDLLLATGTASGKTEAAFMPIVTLMLSDPPKSIGVLYISPLKALINDQFARLGALLSETNIPVCKWHGDASASSKRRLVTNPSGILQITPESLEGLLIRGCSDMFCDLRFVIIDEVHAFMAGPRGIQVMCLLERLQRIIGKVPRRIGLSATLGDTKPAKEWLSMGTGHRCVAPPIDDEPKRIRLAMFQYDVECEDEESQWAAPQPSSSTSGYFAAPSVISVKKSQFYEELYQFTLGRKVIIFARSRSDVEQTILNLRMVAKEHKTPDIYRAHHGSVSASYRERTERELKSSEDGMVVGATITLELGIDIGELDMVVQLDAPTSASAFVQRLGRCGRKGQRAELMFFLTGKRDNIIYGGYKRAGSVYRLTNSGYDVYSFDWSLIKSIAIVQLYLTEKWVEPPDVGSAPYSLLYHQTMAHLLSFGACSPSDLARAVLTLAPFRAISPANYQILLRHLISIGHILRTEDGLLMLGTAAEPTVCSYQFCAVFESPDEYEVQHKGQSIGSIYGEPPIGSKIVLAGKVWECVKVLESRKTILVDEASGSGNARWQNAVTLFMHDRIASGMREVLSSDTVYQYMDESAVGRLIEMRSWALRIGMLELELIPLVGGRYMLCPWVGTRRLFTWALALESRGVYCELMPGSFDPVYLVVSYSGMRVDLERIVREIGSNGVDLDLLPLTENHVVASKYNEFVPLELLHDQYRRDALCADLGNACREATKLV